MCVALKSHAWKHETENMKPKSAVFLHSTEKQWNLQIVKRNHASMSGSFCLGRLVHFSQNLVHNCLPLQERTIFFVVDASIQEAFVKIGKLAGKVLQKSRSCLHTNTKNKRSLRATTARKLQTKGNMPTQKSRACTRLAGTPLLGKVRALKASTKNPG